MTEQRKEATTFDLEDAPVTHRHDGTATQRQHYSRLRQANREGWTGNWVDENTLNQSDWDATIDAVASQFELTNYQTNRAKELFDRLPERFQRAYSLHLLAFCVCTIAGAEDGRDYHPNRLHDNADHSRYKHLAREYDVTYSQVYACWSRIRDALDL